MGGDWGTEMCGGTAELSRSWSVFWIPGWATQSTEHTLFVPIAAHDPQDCLKLRGEGCSRGTLQSLESHPFHTSARALPPPTPLGKCLFWVCFHCHSKLIHLTFSEDSPSFRPSVTPLFICHLCCIVSCLTHPPPSHISSLSFLRIWGGQVRLAQTLFNLNAEHNFIYKGAKVLLRN